jgi:hypothetical protein
MGLNMAYAPAPAAITAVDKTLLMALPMLPAIPDAPPKIA